VELEELSILDVAPSMLHGLGLPIPADFEGRVPAEAMAPGFREQKRKAPVLTPAGYPSPPKAAKPTLSHDDEKKLAAHLRALGYLE
jgi:hypothetical protein